MIYDANGNRADGHTGLTCVPGYPSRDTQADIWNGTLPSHHRKKGNGATHIGFQSVHKPVFRGQLQVAMEREELDEIVLDGSGLVIGVDKRLYEPRRGLIDCLAPVTATGKSGSVYVNQVNWDSFPPLDQLAFLFDEFFSKYDREVLMIVGEKRDGSGWLFHVPKQEGSTGLVTWTASDGEMEWFSGLARWVGTIHVHPGNSCIPSSTDIDDWAEPEKSGLHVIFGRNGDYTINGAIAGKTFELNSGTLKDYVRTLVEWTTSGRRPLNELLLQPKPVKVLWPDKKHEQSKKDRWTHFGNQNQIHMPKHSTSDGDESNFVTWMLERGGVSTIKIEQSQLGSMRVVFHKGSYYMMTLTAWLDMKSWGEELVDTMPPVKRLSIYPVKGGKM